MSVPFAIPFLSVEPGPTEYGPDGSVIENALVVRTEFGSIQPVTGKDSLPLDTGARDIGNIKIYTETRLASRERGQSSGAFIAFAGRIYELVSESPYQCGPIPHYKYIAELCPASRLPQGVAEALGVL
jgi:hypothetical protein